MLLNKPITNSSGLGSESPLSFKWEECSRRSLESPKDISLFYCKQLDYVLISKSANNDRVPAGVS